MTDAAEAFAAPDAARAEAAAALKAVRASLDGNGIGGDDIKTLSFDIQPCGSAAFAPILSYLWGRAQRAGSFPI